MVERVVVVVKGWLCRECRALRGVARTHKGLFHLSIIGFIGWNLMTEAASLSDWGFVVLALLFEVDGGE